jgi:hypothetical protein
MSTPRRKTPVLPLDDAGFAVKQRKTVPHEFVLDAIAALFAQDPPHVRLPRGLR